MKMPKALVKKVGHALSQRGAEPPGTTSPLSTQSTSPFHQLFLALSILLIAGSNNLLAIFQSLCLLARFFSIPRAEVIFLLNLALFRALREASLSESGMLQRRKN